MNGSRGWKLGALVLVGVGIFVFAQFLQPRKTATDEARESLDKIVKHFEPDPSDASDDQIEMDARLADSDGDGIYGLDNCPANYNPGQRDIDGDGRGDACDACSVGGIGVRVKKFHSAAPPVLEIVEVSDGSPAQRADLRVGDLIAAVNGRRDYADFVQMANAVQGEPGTTVGMVVLRNDVELTRRVVELTRACLDSVAEDNLSDFTRPCLRPLP